MAVGTSTVEQNQASRSCLKGRGHPSSPGHLYTSPSRMDKGKSSAHELSFLLLTVLNNKLPY